MAIIYTEINGTIDPLVARIYADGVDIHNAQLSSGVFIPPHPLRACVSFQWEFNDRMTGWQPISGAIFDSYMVDTTTVSASGDYRCVVTIGTGDDASCVETTDTRTIAIIDCGDTSAITFANAGGNGSRTIAPIFPHFLAGQITETHPSWINTFSITCAQTPQANVCTEVETLTATANALNFARNGYVDITIGDFLCSYPVQQQFLAAAPDPVPPTEPDPEDPPLGPTLTTSSFNDEFTVGSIAVVVGTAQVVTDSGIDMSVTADDFTWTVSGDTTDGAMPIPIFLNGSSSRSVTVDTSVIGPKTVTFEVTINNITVTSSITVDVVTDLSATEPGVLSGETTGRATARTLAFGSPNDAPALDPNTSHFTNTFTVQSGTATLSLDFFDRSGAQAIPYLGEAEFEWSIEGPGIINGRQDGIITLAAGTVGTGNLYSPNYVPGVQMSEEITGFDVTSHPDGYLVPGNYTIYGRINYQGDRNGNRFWNIHFAPTISYQIFANFNFNFFNL